VKRDAPLIRRWVVGAIADGLGDDPCKMKSQSATFTMLHISGTENRLTLQTGTDIARSTRTTNRRASGIVFGQVQVQALSK